MVRLPRLSFAQWQDVACTWSVVDESLYAYLFALSDGAL